MSVAKHLIEGRIHEQVDWESMSINGLVRGEDEVDSIDDCAKMLGLKRGEDIVWVDADNLDDDVIDDLSAAPTSKKTNDGWSDYHLRKLDGVDFVAFMTGDGYVSYNFRKGDKSKALKIL